MQAKHPINVFINGRFLTQKITGIQRYAREITLALDRGLSDGDVDPSRYDFTLFTPQNADRLPLEKIPTRPVGQLKGHLWDQLDLPRHTRKGILLNLASTGPLVQAVQAVAIHDAAIYANPANFSKAYRTVHKILGTVLARPPRRILTVSEFSKSELSRYLRTPDDRFTVVYNSGEHIRRVAPDESVLAKHGLERRGFVLCFGSASPNKNIAALSEALPLMREQTQLVAVGHADPTVFGALMTPGDTRLIRAGSIDDAQLRALYEHATAFVFPSLYEGAGIPPLEAMSLGCPVLVSQTSAMPEICGDAALYVDPTNPESIAQCLDKLLANPMLIADLRQRGYKQAKRFSWRASAQRVLDEIRSLESALV